jgi:hypothetical protein
MGKTRETSNQIDPNLTAASRRNLERAEMAQMIPFMPNRGNTVAGFTPQQLAAFGMADNAATSMGFESAGPYSGPDGSTVGGIYGHSAGGQYDDMMNKSVPMGMQDYINSFFHDPNGPPSSGGGSGIPFGGNNGGMSNPMDHDAPPAMPGYYNDPYQEVAFNESGLGGAVNSAGQAVGDAAGAYARNTPLGRAIGAVTGGNDGGNGGK